MKKPYIIAVTMFLLITLWMTSGLLWSSDDKDTTVATKQAEQRMLVETRQQYAETVALNLTVQGNVEPNRRISVRNDIEGRIIQIHVEEGKWVSASTVLFSLDIEDREIKLAKENAILLSRQKSYARTQQLVKQNLQPQSTLEDEYAALKTAEANVAQLQFEINKLTVTAPFDGVLNTLLVEQNSYVSANTELGSFVDNSKLVVVAPVAQQSIGSIAIGTQASVNFATGETKTGNVKFISSVANESTRTFRVEVDVSNSDMRIRAGISAEITIPTKVVQGYFVSPAILVLDEKGQIGVKSVNEQNKVVFTPVNIIKATTEGVWVDGLPASVNIITTGQGFVEAGVEVDYKTASPLAMGFDLATTLSTLS